MVAEVTAGDFHGQEPEAEFLDGIWRCVSDEGEVFGVGWLPSAARAQWRMSRLRFAWKLAQEFKEMCDAL